MNTLELIYSIGYNWNSAVGMRRLIQVSVGSAIFCVHTLLGYPNWISKPTINCRTVFALMSRAATEPSPAELEAFWNFLRRKGINPDQSSSTLDKQLTDLYAQRNYTPTDFLRSIATKHPSIADIANDLLRIIEKTKTKVEWSATVFSGRQLQSQTILLSPLQATALGRRGITIFLTSLQHELTHRIHPSNLKYHRGMSFEEFKRLNSTYYAGDELSAHFSEMKLEIELINRGWPNATLGGTENYKDRILAIATESGFPTLSSYHRLIKELSDANGHDYRKEWAILLKNAYEIRVIEDEANQILYLANQTSLPLTERIDKAQRVLGRSRFRDDTLDEVEQKLRNSREIDLQEFLHKLKSDR